MFCNFGEVTNLYYRFPSYILASIVLVTLRLHSRLIWFQSIPFNKREFQKKVTFYLDSRCNFTIKATKEYRPLRESNSHTDTFIIPTYAAVIVLSTVIIWVLSAANCICKIIIILLSFRYAISLHYYDRNTLILPTTYYAT